jgi:DNA-binding CsgD family transcriptional regulator
MVENRLLTPRQLDVLRGKQDRLLSKEIADKLNISERAVERHLAAIRERLGVSTIRAALQIATTNGWLGTENPNPVGLPELVNYQEISAISGASERWSIPQSDAALQEELVPFDYDVSRHSAARPVQPEVDHDTFTHLKSVALIIGIACCAVIILANYPKIIDLAQKLSIALLNHDQTSHSRTVP